ncbi:hypothetical protein AX17_002233, partial [Amanita inopinata Kibby_2008]
MFTKFALTALLATIPAFLANADVTPSEPGPNSVYKAGGTCHVSWDADTSSPTAWKNMAIELMTGSNYNMVHLTTVAMNLDGTTSGAIDFPCPQVTPNSAIYFYQFTSPTAPDKQWTTRFTIASSSGGTTPPQNPTQPGTGEAVPWGAGSLVDPTTATPPPAYLSNGGSTATSSANSTTSASASLASTVLGTGSSVSSATDSTNTRFTTIITGATPTASGVATVTPTSQNGAASLVDGHVRMTGVLAAGNYGFKDQWLALEWVRSNIEVFGGDPENIHINGLSAGVHSVHQLPHHASCLPDGQHVPFHSAVLQSNAILTNPKTPKELRPQFCALRQALSLDWESPDILDVLLTFYQGDVDPALIMSRVEAASRSKYTAQKEARAITPVGTNYVP